MGTWTDDYELTDAARAKLAELDAEWKAIDAKLAAQPSESERATLLGRLDEIEYEVDEAVRACPLRS